MVGEASGAAEAFGVRAGMRLGEALSRCPELVLVPPDPVRAEAAWEEALRRAGGDRRRGRAGAPGEAFFEAGRCAGSAASPRGPRAGAAGARAAGSARRRADPALRLRRGERMRARRPA